VASRHQYYVPVRQACTGRTSSAEKCLDRCKSDQNCSLSFFCVKMAIYY
jgi:hypothetical protein